MNLVELDRALRQLRLRERLVRGHGETPPKVGVADQDETEPAFRRPPDNWSGVRRAQGHLRRRYPSCDEDGRQRASVQRREVSF